MTEKEVEFLVDWVKRHIENKDVVFKKIESSEKRDDCLYVKYKDKEATFLAVPSIKDDSVLEKLKGINNYKTLVTLNHPSNIEFVIKNWDKLVELGRELSIYFVNPFSKTERIWIVHPYTHNFIADMDSLELGLKTMSENVEYISEDEFKKIITS
ncbi:hypothetical protein ACFLZ7_00075 [Nanoarchaeota archaeon]